MISIKWFCTILLLFTFRVDRDGVVCGFLFFLSFFFFSAQLIPIESTRSFHVEFFFFFVSFDISRVFVPPSLSFIYFLVCNYLFI